MFLPWLLLLFLYLVPVRIRTAETNGGTVGTLDRQTLWLLVNTRRRNRIRRSQVHRHQDQSSVYSGFRIEAGSGQGHRYRHRSGIAVRILGNYVPFDLLLFPRQFRTPRRHVHQHQIVPRCGFCLATRKP